MEAWKDGAGLAAEGRTFRTQERQDAGTQHEPLGGIMNVIRRAGRSRGERRPWARLVLAPFFLAVAGLGTAACGPSGVQSPAPTASAQSAEVGASALSAKGRVIRVPADQPTIAAAMAVARAGDTVKLDPGTYKETLVLKTGVRVVGGPSTIDATGLDNGIVGDASVTSGASVEQLTVQNSTYQGVYIGGSKGVRLSNCTIRACGVESGSAGLRTDDAQLSIENSEISGSGGAGIRVVTTDLTLIDSQSHDNPFAGLRADDSTIILRRNVVKQNGGGVILNHGVTAMLEGNHLLDNRGSGVAAYAGSDESDQVRSRLRMTGNTSTGNVLGLELLNSDASSFEDQFDRNGFGILAGFGANLSARNGSASSNSDSGLWARDLIEYFFCENEDCSLTKAVSATVRYDLDGLRMENNVYAGLNVAPGGDGKVTGCIFRGNDFGTIATSGLDYQLGDGVLRHIDVPVKLQIESSLAEQNRITGYHAMFHSDLRLTQSIARANVAQGVVATDGASATLQENQITSNTGAGVLIQNGSSARIEHNVVSDGGGDGVLIVHGATAVLESNRLERNHYTGAAVLGGYDLFDQARSTARLNANRSSGNGGGIYVYGSDLVEEADQLEDNQWGLVVAFGASVSSSNGAIRGSQYTGVVAQNALDFFCANEDCTRRQLGVAPTSVTLKGMRVEENRNAGLQGLAGARVTVRDSRFEGNGAVFTGGGIQVNSNWAYDLGDGVVRYIDIPGSVEVRGSEILRNVGSGALLLGNSTLDLGTASRGANSFAGNAPFAVVNASTAQAPLPAESNWWGTADRAAIAALMSGPVDFVPFLMSPPH